MGKLCSPSLATEPHGRKAATHNNKTKTNGGREELREHENVKQNFIKGTFSSSTQHFIAITSCEQQQQPHVTAAFIFVPPTKWSHQHAEEVNNDECGSS
jgi:hypothetical protein